MMKRKNMMETIGMIFASIAIIHMITFCILCLWSRKYMIDLFVGIFFGAITRYMYKKRMNPGLFWKMFCIAMCTISAIKYSWKCIFYSGYGVLFGIGIVLSIIAFAFFISASDIKKKENTDGD